MAERRKAKPGNADQRLLESAENGDFNSVKKAVEEEGASVNCYDWIEQQPIHKAAKGDHKETLQYLVTMGADINAEDRIAEQPIHLAARTGNKETLQYLITMGADVNAKGKDGDTPLCLAAYFGNVQVLTCLISAGADLEAKNNAGRTPLWRAASAGHPEVLTCLIDADADLEAKNNDEETPLWIATLNGELEVLTCLIGAGVDLEAKNNDEETPLWIAAHYGELEMLTCLIGAGADLEAKNNDGKTAFQTAFEVNQDSRNSEYKRERCRQALRTLIAAGAAADFRPEEMKAVDLEKVVPGSNLIVVSSNEDCQELLHALEKGKDYSNEMLFKYAIAPYTILIHNQRSQSINKILTMVPDGVEQLLIIGASGGKVNLDGLTKRNLPDLKRFEVNYCKLEKVPSGVFDHLGSLEILTLSHNRLRKLPETIGILGNLRVLHLQDNRLKKIPDGIGNLDRLEDMNIAKNSLSELPITVIGHLKKIKGFSFDDNPLTLMMGSNIDDILVYLEALSEGAVANTEFKLHVIGDAEVGKTTMISAMTSKKGISSAKINKTKGIDVHELKMKNLQCRIFDTGGDVEFLETHMLFTSGNTIYLIVFNLAAFGFGKDRLGRLETWLQAIYLQYPNARVILVGTHADNPKVNKQVRDSVREDVTKRLLCGHEAHRQRHEGNEVDSCILCKPVLTLEGACGDSLSEDTAAMISDEQHDSRDNRDSKDNLRNSGDTSPKENVNNPCSINIPHVVGYFEVSSIQIFPSTIKAWKGNQSMSKVVKCVKSEGEKILVKEIPHKWNEMKKALVQRADEARSKKTQSVMSLADFKKLAAEYSIAEETINTLSSFLVNTGYIIHHKAVSDMVVYDPQWLSDQLCTLISFDSNVLDQGFLAHSKLTDAWSHIPPEYHEKLLRLFRDLSICFSVDDVTELFPCKLPIGLPDPDTWPQEPDKNERQLTYIYEFRFLPLDLFPRYVAEVNTNKEEFHEMSTQFYSSNHVVYLTTKKLPPCQHGTKLQSNILSNLHRVHSELVPYRNQLAVTVRGPNPCCLIEEIYSVIKTLAGEDVIIEKILACPKCLIQDGLLEPAGRSKGCEGVCCKKDHTSGLWQDVVTGTLLFECSISDQIRRLDEGLHDKECPKLFAVLPINKDALPLKDLVVYTLLKDGIAVHLMCESPDGPHFTSAPGLRLSKPNEFLEKHGPRVYKVLWIISQLEMPLNLIAKGAALLPLATAAKGTRMAGKGAAALKSLLEDFENEYPNVAKQAENIDLLNPNKAEGLERRELARMLNHRFDKNQDQFGGLIPTRVHTHVKWLCKKHNKEYSEARK